MPRLERKTFDTKWLIVSDVEADTLDPATIQSYDEMMAVLNAAPAVPLDQLRAECMRIEQEL